MTVFAFWNLVATFVFGGLCFSLLWARRKYRKVWMDRGATLCVVLAFVSFAVSLVHH